MSNVTNIRTARLAKLLQAVETSIDQQLIEKGLTPHPKTMTAYEKAVELQKSALWKYVDQIKSSGRQPR